MKLSLLVFLNAALCLSVFAQQKTDKDLDDLRGPIRTVRTTVTYEIKEAGKTVKKDVVSERSETYDRQGNLIERSDGGQLSTGKSLFSRDAQGRRVEKMTPDPPNPNDPPPPKLPGGQVRDDAFLTFDTTYQYDPEKRRLEATTHRRNGQLLQIDTYLFDEKGWLVEHARKNRPEDVDGAQFRFVYKRDAQGAVIESTSYTVDGKISSRELYQDIVVDKHGNWTRRTLTMLDANGKADNVLRTSVRVITYY
jgi:hypothetical protein